MAVLEAALRGIWLPFPIATAQRQDAPSEREQLLLHLATQRGDLSMHLRGQVRVRRLGVRHFMPFRVTLLFLNFRESLRLLFGLLRIHKPPVHADEVRDQSLRSANRNEQFVVLFREGEERAQYRRGFV